MTRRLHLATLLLAAVLTCPDGLGAQQRKEQLAVEAAEHWLAVVDDGRYAESWDGAAELFRNAVPRDQWVASLNAHRTPLGALVERTPAGSRYTTSLPGAPDGEYVVVQFRAVFRNKQEAVETVTPMLDPDGAWRVSGYYIR